MWKCEHGNTINIFPAFKKMVEIKMWTDLHL
jgi:hypothetical protein